jgi:hypothetical protein
MEQYTPAGLMSGYAHPVRALKAKPKIAGAD